MVGERQDQPADGYDAELRQIDALNKMAPLPPGPPGRGMPETASRDRDAGRRRDCDLLGTGHALAQADSLGSALRLMSRLAHPDFPLRSQIVFGVTEKRLHAVCQHGFHPGRAEQDVLMPMNTGYPAAEVARTGRAVYLSSPQEYRHRFPSTWQLSFREGHRAWAFLPLTTGGEVTGVWLAAFRTPLSLTPGERRLLEAAAGLINQGLERARAGEAELALSQGLRRTMGLPGPGVAGLTVATRYVPTGGGLVVGGDWYDSMHLPNGRLGLVIGDVQGHDVHAASLMSQLRTAIHAYAAEGHGPDAVLVRASHFLAALDEDRFATCVYLEADPATGTLHLARAGHPHPVLRLPDGTCLLKHLRGGLPLGLTPGEGDYPVNVLRLDDDEILMLCTDGLIETGGHDMYSGWLRVRDALGPGPTDDLEELAERLLGAVVAPQSPERRGRLFPRAEDDIALLLLRRDAGGPRPADVTERRLVLTLGQDQAHGLAEARAELEALLHDWAQPEQVDTAVLLASELLGNVLVHTEQSAALSAYLTGEPGSRCLRVEVTDRSDDLPHQRAPGELASSGRGLILLDLLAHRWGVRPEPEGKTIWFRLHEDRPAGDV